MNENKKGSNTLYAILGVATLIVAIIGATFAYFSAAATPGEGSDAITGQTDNDLASALSLSVDRVEFTETGANSDHLVPTDLTADEDGINAAVAAKCVDDGYTGCHIYKITASSSKTIANASVRLTSLTVSATDQDAWSYAIYTNDGTSNNATSMVSGGAGDFVSFANTYTGEGKTGFDMHGNTSLTANTPVYYYLVIYLANINDQVQNPEETTNEYSGTGRYDGSVSMDVLGGKVVASFSSSS